MKTMTMLVIVGLSATAVIARQHDHAAMTRAASGGTTTLSAEQIAQLLNGEGMGLAKPAELNHYPGPRHLLELATDLQLSSGQKARIETIRAGMLSAAQHLGAQIVETERALDAAFAAGTIDASQLQTLTATIARLQGDLRAAHLGAHLEARALLTPAQITGYDRLRGYVK